MTDENGNSATAPEKRADELAWAWMEAEMPEGSTGFSAFLEEGRRRVAVVQSDAVAAYQARLWSIEGVDVAEAAATWTPSGCATSPVGASHMIASLAAALEAATEEDRARPVTDEEVETALAAWFRAEHLDLRPGQPDEHVDAVVANSLRSKNPGALRVRKAVRAALEAVRGAR